jgi:hypothetical protein
VSRVAAGEGPRRYAILHRYGSGTYGPWEIGTTVELLPSEADWVNHDSPGTLAEIEPGVKLTTGQPVPASKLKKPETAGEAAAPPEGDDDSGGAASTDDTGGGTELVADKPRGRGRGAGRGA